MENKRLEKFLYRLFTQTNEKANKLRDMLDDNVKC